MWPFEPAEEISMCFPMPEVLLVRVSDRGKKHKWYYSCILDLQWPVIAKCDNSSEEIGHLY